MAVVAQPRGNRQIVCHNDQRHGNIEQVSELITRLPRFEAVQIFRLRQTDHLDLVGMDEIQVSDQGEDGLVRLYADTVVRTRIAGGPGKLQLVLVVVKQAADGDTGHILFFGQDGAGFFRRSNRHQRFSDAFLGKLAGQFG